MHNDAERYYLSTKLVKQPALLGPTGEGVPVSWTKVLYKTYPRFASIPLAVSDVHLANDSLPCRRSERAYSTAPLSFKQLADLVYWSAGIQPGNENATIKRRMYPSAGARYPIELYVVSERVEGLPLGLYHYNVLDNVLERLWRRDLGSEMQKVYCQDDLTPAATLCLTGVLSRSEVKYGANGLRFALLEAGHVGQNICLLAHSEGLSCCPVGGFDNDRLTCLLDLSDGEVPLYVFTLGVGTVT